MSDVARQDAQNLIHGMRAETSPSYRMVYSNLFRWRMTAHELSLIFSTIGDPNGGVSAPVVTDEIQLMLSLPVAKSLMEYLTILLGRFEREVAPINAGGKAPSAAEVDAIIAALKVIGTH